ncbi:unnamed protein product [marine sediment metagenome]|uniref:Uncharacterized protein n=1 Tax=marine sediment metagenome TaxID=412755 RepID=X1KCL4_9ZZZZ
MERFAQTSLYYDWLTEEGYPPGLSVLSDLSDEEIVSFIRYIIKRWENELEKVAGI